LVFDFMDSACQGLLCERAHHTVRQLVRSSHADEYWNNSNALLSDTRVQIVIGNVLSADELALVRETMARADYEDGRATAGFAAQLVKNNRQATRDRKIETVRKLVEERILGNDVFALAVRPKALTSVMFSAYERGMHYGSHVDDALMQGMRTDVSFTLFLSDPDSYDGGELVIESVSGEDAVKLDAGSLVAYPSTTLHHVVPVTRGTRLAAVGWARSFVRDGARREMLFDLDTARRQLFAREGKSAEYDLVSKSFANLLRMWVED
jgi:PKHD-type hydroxylase